MITSANVIQIQIFKYYNPQLKIIKMHVIAHLLYPWQICDVVGHIVEIICVNLDVC